MKKCCNGKTLHSTKSSVRISIKFQSHWMELVGKKEKIIFSKISTKKNQQWLL